MNGDEVIGSFVVVGTGLRLVAGDAKNQAIRPAYIHVAVHVERTDTIIGRLQRLRRGVANHG